MKFLRTLIASILITSQAFAGLPPTTSQGVGDTSGKTTFQYAFPNYTVSHTGTKATFGILNPAGGGMGADFSASSGIMRDTAGVFSAGTIDLSADTGATPLPFIKGGTGTAAASKAAAFNALSPGTTVGDIITTGPSGGQRHAVPGDGGSLVGDSSQTDGWRNASYIQLSGKPGKNYVQYASFENGLTTGWSAIGCATLVNGLPTCVGTSGAALSASNGGRTKGANTNAPAIDTSSALAGTNALNLATTGAGVAGDGYVSSALTIDKEDQGKILNFKLYYKVVTGTANLTGTSSNTYAVAVYDLVNNAFIPVAGAFNFVQGTGAGIATGTFQTPINLTSFQVFIYSPTAPPATSSILLDDVFVGPQSTSSGPAMTDWVGYTPTITGFGTPSAVHFYSRRVGDSLEVQGQFVNGTTTATASSMTLGYNGTNGNVTADITKMPSQNIVGHGSVAQASTTYFTIDILSVGSTPGNLAIGVQSSGSTSAVIANGSSVVTSGTVQIDFYAKVPIVGWSSNTVQSSDSSQNVVTATVGLTNNLSYTSGPILYDTVVSDKSSMYSVSTGRITVPVTGSYAIYVINESSGAPAVYLQKNGSNSNYIVSCANANKICAGGVILPLNAGDYITVLNDATGTLAGSAVFQNMLSVERISGPAVVQATESVNGTYSDTTARSIGTSFANLSYSLKVKDTHNAYNGTTLTIPVSGQYHLAAKYQSIGTALSSSQGCYISINRNGTLISVSPNIYGNGGTLSYLPIVDIEYPMLAGDLITVQATCSIATTTNGAANISYFTWNREGN